MGFELTYSTTSRALRFEKFVQLIFAVVLHCKIYKTQRRVI